MPHFGELRPTKTYFWTTDQDLLHVPLGDYNISLIDATFELVNIKCYIPWDFHRIVSLAVVYIGVANLVDMAMDVLTDYASAGEAYNMHSEAATVTFNTTANIIGEYDISALVDAGPIQAGDCLGVECTYNAGPPPTNVYILGVRLRYR